MTLTQSLMEDRQELREGLAELRKVIKRFQFNLEYHRKLLWQAQDNLETFRKLQEEFKQFETSSGKIAEQSEITRQQNRP